MLLQSWLPHRREREKVSSHRPGRACARFAPSRLRVEQLEDRCVPAVDVILEWNAVMLQADVVTHSVSPAEQPGPVLSARAFAMTSAAMYDAYNSIERIGERYLISVPNARNADSDAAVAQAAHIVLSALYPNQRATFDAALAQTLQRIPDGASENRGRAVGAIVAGAILIDRANDGGNTLDDIQNPPYEPNGRPGFHDVDPVNPGQGFYGPDAGNIEPFAVRSTEQFAAGHLGAQGVGSDRTDIADFLRTRDYEEAYDEVKRLGGDGVTTPTERTAEQTEIGIFWAYDGRPGLGTPPRLYNQIARTVAIQEGNTEAENARLFALGNIAMADAATTAWEAKYDEEFWRPVLGIRRGGEDGNRDTRGDPNWTPLGAPASNSTTGERDFTPPFPAYTSGHATIGAAMFQTLERFYGTSNITFSFVSDELNGITRDSDGQVRPVAERTFTSFDQASRENADSRIYLGIHWRFDADEGIRSGNGVANYVFDNFLEPRDRDGDGDFTTTSTTPDVTLTGALDDGGTTPDATLTGALDDGGTTPTDTSGDPLAAPPPAPTGTDPSSDTSVGSTPASPVTSGTTDGTEPIDPTDLLFQFPELFADDIV